MKKCLQGFNGKNSKTLYHRESYVPFPSEDFWVIIPHPEPQRYTKKKLELIAPIIETEKLTRISNELTLLCQVLRVSNRLLAYSVILVHNWVDWYPTSSHHNKSLCHQFLAATFR